jgi:hypothetical protein
MLVPLTRKKFEALMPLLATGNQYLYCWGKIPDLLARLLWSIIGGVVVLFLDRALDGAFKLLLIFLGVAAITYILWGPILKASLRNAEYRKLPYAGFWRGRVLDIYVTEELIGKEETVNKRGDLVIVENRENCLNLEVGDSTGFSTLIQVPLQREHRAIAIGDVAEMLVLSKVPDLSRIARVSDVYLPEQRLWVSGYPYLRRDAFVEVSDYFQSQRRAATRGDRRRSRY